MTGLAPPLGEPRRIDPRRRTVVVWVLSVVMVVSGAVGGFRATRAEGDPAVPAPGFLLALIAFTALFSIWPGISFRVRSDGRVLEGRGLLGRHGIDLTRLTHVGSAATGRSVFLALSDDVGTLKIDSRLLRRAGRPVLDVVGRAVWQGQQEGRYVVPRGAAQVWGMPARPDAPGGSTTGTTRQQLVVVAMIAAAIGAGVLLGQLV